MARPDRDFDQIDFTKYDLTSLGGDVRSIVDIPDAIAKTAKWAFGIPAVVGVLSWLVFDGRMPTWVLVPFVLAAMAMSVIGSVFLGGLSVARTRLDTVSEATGRVVTVMGAMHADVAQLKAGASTTSVRAVATGLLDNAIFPVAFGVAEGMGPMARFGNAPMKLVKKSVLGAVERLPDKELGAVADDVSGSLPTMAARLSSLNEHYESVAGQIEGVVNKVSKGTLWSFAGTAALAMLPLVVWLAIGFIAS